MQEETKKGEIVIYKSANGPELQIRMEGNSVWMTQAQIANLFQTDRTSIGRHMRNILKTAELREKSVCAIFAHTASDGKVYRVQYYNLDMIISVGYRVNSSRATQFRIWATQRLGDYLLKGYSINEKRLKEEHNTQLKELQKTVKLFQNVIATQRTQGYEKDLLNIILDYANTWSLLNKYDEGGLEIEGVSKKSSRVFDHEEVIKTVSRFKARLVARKEASQLFGQEVGNKFAAVLGSIYQTFNGLELYSSLEEKAAHLLYFVIKDHPFVDGNKRIASLMFLIFLVENNFLVNRKGERKINDSALVALALLIAESKPQDKEIMIKLVVNLIKNN